MKQTFSMEVDSVTLITGSIGQLLRLKIKVVR